MPLAGMEETACPALQRGTIASCCRANRDRTMLNRSPDAAKIEAQSPRLDFQEHLKALEAEGLVTRIDRPINKDTELHPLVRWQFLGGVPEADRRAFVFTNVIDSKGRRYEIPVVIG